MLRHILITFTKIKDKKNIKSDKGIVTSNIQGNPYRLSADFSAETLQARGSGMKYLKWWKRKTYNQESSTQQDSGSESTEKSKAL